MLPPSHAADRETLETYVKGDVPVLVIYDPKQEKVSVLKGNQSLEDIILASSGLLAKRKEEKK